MASGFGCALAIVLVLQRAVLGQDAEVDTFLRAEMTKGHIPGLAVAVVKDGSLIQTKAYGVASVELQAPVSTETVFEIASITKPFTATAAMLLVDEGKLSLDDPVSRYFADAPDAWSKMKVRHLLSHTGGLQRDPFPLTSNAARLDYEAVEILQKVRGLPLLFEPGTAFSYSNVGYFLLGQIIERSSGQSFADFLRARIFLPLGMASTRVNDRRAVLPHRAAGYELEGESLRVAEQQSPTLYAAAGGIVSTVLDMAKWGELFRPERLLSLRSLQQALEPTGLPSGSSTGYGLGWNVDFHRGHRCYNHSGGIRGFRSAFLHYPQYGLTIVVLCNLSPAEPERLARAVAGFHVPGLAPLSSLAEGTDPKPNLTETLFGALLALRDGKETAILAPEFAEAFRGWAERRDLLARDLSGLRCFAYIGEDRELDSGLYRPGGAPRRMWHCRLLTAKETRFYSFSLNASDRVCWIDMLTDS